MILVSPSLQRAGYLVLFVLLAHGKLAKTKQTDEQDKASHAASNMNDQPWYSKLWDRYINLPMDSPIGGVLIVVAVSVIVTVTVALFGGSAIAAVRAHKYNKRRQQTKNYRQPCFCLQNFAPTIGPEPMSVDKPTALSMSSELNYQTKSSRSQARERCQAGADTALIHKRCSVYTIGKSTPQWWHSGPSALPSASDIDDGWEEEPPIFVNGYKQTKNERSMR